MQYNSQNYDADFWQGVLVITDKAQNELRKVTLRDASGRNVTLQQFKASIKSRGFDKACSVFFKFGVK